MWIPNAQLDLSNHWVTSAIGNRSPHRGKRLPQTVSTLQGEPEEGQKGRAEHAQYSLPDTSQINHLFFLGEEGGGEGGTRRKARHVTSKPLTPGSTDSHMETWRKEKRFP